jgi:hypothetical protein
MLSKSSKFLSLNALDFVKGLITAVFGAIAGIIIPIVQSGSFAIDWMLVLKVAITAILGYLSKNLFTNSDGQFLKKES